MSIFLKKEERQILFIKYKKSGLSNWDAQKRLDDFVASLNNLVITLQLRKKRKIEKYRRLGKANLWIIRQEKEEEEKIENKFRQAFEGMCQFLEN